MSIIIWWIILILFPESRVHFLGQVFAEKFIWILIVPDLISAVALGTWLVPAILKNKPHINTIAWLHTGGQGFAFFVSLALAIIDPHAYWGFIGMLFSTGIAFFLAVRIQNLDVLWESSSSNPLHPVHLKPISNER
jgi:hypothetical protein